MMQILRITVHVKPKSDTVYRLHVRDNEGNLVEHWEAHPGGFDPAFALAELAAKADSLAQASTAAGGIENLRSQLGAN